MKNDTTSVKDTTNSMKTSYPPEWNNETKCTILKQLLVNEADRGFAGYLYELIPDVEYMYGMNKTNDFENASLQQNFSKPCLISWIAGLCNPVYIFELNSDAAQYQLYLFIVLQPQDDRNFKELQSYIQMATMGRWCIHFTLCQLAMFDDLRSQGSLFHIVNCSKEQLVYAQNTATLKLIDKNKVAEMLTKAQTYVSVSNKRSMHFFDKAVPFQKEGANELACFVLHQAAEISLRGFAEAFSGIQLRQHAIKKLLHQCSQIHKEFAFVFKTATECEMLAILEASYIEARYNADFKVTDQNLALLKEKVLTILQLTDALSKQCIKAFALKMGDQSLSK